jgi:hypothetical protein
VAALLLETAPPMEPPAGLRDRILAAARAETVATAPDVGTGRAPLRMAGAPAPDVSAAPATPTIIRRTDRSWWAQPPWLLTVAAALLVAVLAGWNINLRVRLDDAEEQLASAQRQADLQAQALAAVAGRGQMIRFASSIPGASGSVLRPEEGQATLVVDGLPLTPDKTYQVWAIRGDQPVSLGVFNPDDSGVKVFEIDHDLQDVDAVAITLEPAPSGSPLPTASPVLVAALRG